MLGKIATWMVWTAFTIVVAIFVYRHTDLISPATAHATETAQPGPTSGTPAGTRARSSSNESLLAKIDDARDAYARGDDTRAIALYRECIDMNPKSADIRGELGNVYYMSGRQVDAADVYYDAAKLLLADNRLDDIDRLLPIIAEAKPLLAGELEQNLRTAIGAHVMTPPVAEWVPKTAPQSALTRY